MAAAIKKKEKNMTDSKMNKWSVIINAILTAISSILSSLTLNSCI